MTPTSSCLFSGFFCVRVSAQHRPRQPGIVPLRQGQGQGQGQISEFPTPAGRGNCFLISTLPSVTGTRPRCLSLEPAVLLVAPNCWTGQIRGSRTTCYPGCRAAGRRTRWRLDGRHAPSPHARCTRTGAPDCVLSPVATHQGRSLPTAMTRTVRIRRCYKTQSRNGKPSQPQTASN